MIRTHTIRVVAEQQPPKKVITPMTDLRKKLEQQRIVTLREHLNKLAVVATTDIKLIYDTFLELDVIHKRLFEHSEKEPEKEGENIFLKKEEDQTK